MHRIDVHDESGLSERFPVEVTAADIRTGVPAASRVRTPRRRRVGRTADAQEERIVSETELATCLGMARSTLDRWLRRLAREQPGSVLMKRAGGRRWGFYEREIPTIEGRIAHQRRWRRARAMAEPPLEGA